MTTEERIEAQVEADLARIVRQARKLLTAMYTDTEERENENDLRIDTFGIIGVASWRDENDDECEDVVMAWEPKKHHVQTGILADAMRVHMKRISDE